MRIRRATEDSPPTSGQYGASQTPRIAVGKTNAVTELPRQGFVAKHSVRPTRPLRESAGSSVGAVLQARYPKVCLWYGRFTGHWWALLGDRLVEASNAGELGMLIAMLLPAWQGRISPNGKQPGVAAVGVSGPSGSIYVSGAMVLAAYWDGAASPIAPAIGPVGRDQRAYQGFFRRCGALLAAGLTS